MRSRRRLIILSALALLFLASWFYTHLLLSPLGGVGTVVVQIPKGASAVRIGEILAEAKIIRSARAFSVLARIKGKTADLNPGAYKLSPSMKPAEIIDKVSRGEVCAVWVTFPEGFTIRQIAERLESRGLADAEEFAYLARHGAANFPTDFPHPPNSLEGYLFPDTYLMPLNAPADDLIREMLLCFDRRVARSLTEKVAASRFSLHEIITLASLIEREARVPNERPVISSVLHNRLAIGMRLEVDATVLFALGYHKNRVLYEDLEIDSPYNTYRYAGLPPGPIANPGLECIKAALSPANTDYLFYVARPDGSHIFSRTMAEHQRAKAIARGKAAQQ